MTAIELIENNNKIELICMHVTQSFPQEHSKLDVQNQMKAKGLNVTTCRSPPCWSNVFKCEFIFLERGELYFSDQISLITLIILNSIRQFAAFPYTKAVRKAAKL